MKKEEPKKETQGYVCPRIKKQCDDECCVSDKDWIKVKKQLPEVRELVLCYNKNVGWISCGVMWDDGIWHDSYFLKNVIKPSHWMSLPLPPKQ